MNEGGLLRPRTALSDDSGLIDTQLCLDSLPSPFVPFTTRACSRHITEREYRQVFRTMSERCVLHTAGLYFSAGVQYVGPKKHKCITFS